MRFASLKNYSSVVLKIVDYSLSPTLLKLFLQQHTIDGPNSSIPRRAPTKSFVAKFVSLLHAWPRKYFFKPSQTANFPFYYLLIQIRDPMIYLLGVRRTITSGSAAVVEYFWNNWKSQVNSLCIQTFFCATFEGQIFEIATEPWRLLSYTDCMQQCNR